MTAAAYTTDLTTIDTADSNTFVLLSAAGWTSAGTIQTAETDYFIQGNACASKALKTGVGGLICPAAANFTVPTDGAVLNWVNYGASAGLNTEANGGLRTIIGNSQAIFYAWKHLGNDTYAYGGWVCLATNDTVTPDYTAGSPASPWQRSGYAINPITVPGRGSMFGIDASRVGRCESRFAFGEAGAGYATFLGYAAINDTQTNRWGLIQSVAGGYLWQGLMVLGYVNAVDFRDANRSILVNDTRKVTTNFNTIQISNTSSRIDMTSISFLALGTTSRGRWVTSDNADVNLEGCTFTDMGVFGFLSNTTAIDCVFRRTDQITTGGATLTGCAIDANRANTAVLVSSPANAELISGCTFVSDGTGHGLQITGTAANFTLTNDTWTGYAGSDGSTGNEAVWVNIATGSLNLTVSGGTTPSVNTAGCVVTVISGAVTVTATVTDPDGIAISGAVVFIKAATGGPFPFDTTVTIVNSGTTATVTHTGHGMATNDKVVISGASHNQNNGIFTITRINNDSYSYTMGSAPGSSPTGTIKCTFVILSDTTAGPGTVTMSRVFSSAQPFTGWARKSSGAPFFKQGSMTGTVSSTTGATPGVALVSDD